MRQETSAILAFGIASALILAVVGNGDASLVQAPYGTQAIPGPQPQPSPRPRVAITIEQPPRPTAAPAAGAPPRARGENGSWARSSVYVAGV